MSSIKRFFESVWFFTGHLSKKAYTTGMIVFSGLVAVAVLFIGVNGFTSSANVSHVPAYEVEEEDNSEENLLEELVSEEVTSEESQSYYVEWAIAQYETVQLAEAQRLSITKEPTLAQETDVIRDFRTSGNITEEATITTLSVEDYTALIRIVEAEATGEDLMGKILIANVVMNRVESNRFPDTIYGVVHQKLNGKAQFSPIDDGRYYTVPITSSTEKAVEQALSGVDYSDGALFFVAKSLASESAGSWFDRNLVFIMQHGCHSFYKY